MGLNKNKMLSFLGLTGIDFESKVSESAKTNKSLEQLLKKDYLKHKHLIPCQKTPKNYQGKSQKTFGTFKQD